MERTHYDFAKPERLSKDEMRTINLLCEETARQLEAALSNYLRSFTRVALEGVAQRVFGEIASEFPQPAFLATVSLKPLEGSAVLELGLPVVYCVVDRLLGGTGAGAGRDSREPTEIELKVTDHMLGLVLDAVSSSWSHIIALDPRIEGKETNPRLLKAFTAQEAMVEAKFFVEFNQVKGGLRLAIPLAALKGVSDKLNVQQWLSGTEKNREQDRQAQDMPSLAGIRVPVLCRMTGGSMTLRECVQLKAGDVVRLRGVREPAADVVVKDRVKFTGKAGLWQGKKAVKITGMKGR